MREIKVGMLGFGTVGTGVIKILMQNKDLIRSRVGANLTIKYIADIDTTRDRGVTLPEGVLIPDAWKVVDDPEIEIIIEMIGGDKIAKDLMLRAIQNGKQIVTANKSLLAAQGNMIFREAEKKGVDLAFEASAGGCMPIIKALRESLIGNRITSMTGILNGTCNYILTRITKEGIPFDTALSQAQANGYAEANPALDVEGYDTAHKLAILNALAYGMEINLKDIYVEGISKITPEDIEYAGQFGYIIKLLAISKDMNGSIEARVHPTMIPVHNLLSSVNGSLNAITVIGDSVGDILLYGRGAGMMPTGSAVISDLVDIARNLISGKPGRVPLLSYQMENIRKIPVTPMDNVHTQYYFRIRAQDRPKVLSKISGILGDYGISIKSVHQKGRRTSGSVPVVMFTHTAKEAYVQKALTEMSQLDVVAERPMLIRIEDEDED